MWSQTFSYDAFGNITKTGNSQFQPGYNYQTNQMANGTSYDAMGDVVNDSLHSYAWNSDTRPTTIDSIGVTYDALGRMVEQNNNGTYTQMAYDCLGYKIALMNTTSTVVKGFAPLPGGGTAVYTASGLQYYRHADWLGSSRFSSTPSRTMYNDLAFAPFGETYAPSGSTGVTDISFAGNNEDTTTNLYDAYFREYGIQGRWPSPDPAGIAAANPANPQSWNRYAYVLNDPLAFIDPSGLECYSPGIIFFITDKGVSVFQNMMFSCDSYDLGGPGQAQPLIYGGANRGGGDSGNGPNPNPPPPPPNCASHGFGVGFLGGGTAEGGAGVAGTGASGSIGGGVFYSGPNGVSAGGFIEGGSFANAGSHEVGAPSQGNNSLGLGGFAGVGAGPFITNAGSPQQLSGPFLTFSADIGIPFVGQISVQFSISSNNTFVLSGTFGEGGGIGGSAMITTTKTTGGSCP